MTDERVFMSADDGLTLFPSVEDAAAHMEWVDVEDGVYEALFTVQGERLLPHPHERHLVRLEPSGEVDTDALTSMLSRERDQRGAFTADPDDPQAVARELSERQQAWRWEHRWPKRPQWLDKRLHGEGPAGS
jgi:hypothetical protein